ncbi:MAG TPA: nitroreductase family protein [Clostridiales bacterium]|nr:nitroreductase family protein [Clostridiales bacterium]
MNAIFQRVSVRSYQDRAVEGEKIELILRAAMAAPSAGNQQPWEFYVVRTKEVLGQLSQCSPYAGCTKAAPIAIVPCYRTEGLKFYDYTDIDLSAATQNILLEAVELGLGAVWLGVAPVKDRMEAVSQILGLPEDLHPFAIIPLGYPTKDYTQQGRFDASRIHNI